MTNCPNCGSAVTVGTHYCSSCGSKVESEGDRRPSAETIAIGEQRLLKALRDATLGDYEIQAEIGRGGMAVVYLAHDISLNRKVAIKVMKPALMMMDDDVQRRFKREAQTAASLSHPHIIPVYAVKEVENLVFFVMKYILGRSLESVIKEIGALPVPVVQTILNQAGGALAHAHKRGVVHRDIKPGNIMMDEDGWVVVADFGIAKVAEAEALTMTGGVVGTPAYMSPEQCSGGELTGAADQYSLGVVAYEMITGRTPFKGGTMVNLIYDHCHTEPPPILAARPDCPPELAQVVQRMIAKDPDDRFQSIEEAVTATSFATDSSQEDARTHMMTLVQNTETDKLLKKFQSAGSQIPPQQTPGSLSLPPPSTPLPQNDAPAPTGRRRGVPVWAWAVPLVGVTAAVMWFAIVPRLSEPTAALNEDAVIA
ncbi:MAG: protein kinase, partial [Gemmatimonadales bacterium]